MDTIITLFTDPNAQWVMIGTLLLGIASGILGSFTLLRKQSLIGDAMAHAALPGVCMAYLIYGSKSMIWFLIGAAVAGLLATYFIQSIIHFSRIKEDTSIGLVLSVFFGIGIVLLTFINQNGKGNQSGLDDFIFGQAASLVGADVKIIAGVALVLIVLTFLLFKELKLLTFDPQFAQGIGLPTKRLNGLLMTLIVGAVVIGLQAVGVILMAAMLITPAIAARYWTERLDRMVIIAGVIGGFSGILGTMLSITANKMPTGPLIIVAATMIFLISMCFAPRRGLLMKGIRRYRLKKHVLKEDILQSLYELTEKGLLEGISTFTEDQIIRRRYAKSRELKRMLHRLEKEGMVKKCERNSWSLSKRGLPCAYDVTFKNRLMEVYLMNEMNYAEIKVNQDHQTDIFDLPKKMIKELTDLLSVYNLHPKLITPRDLRDTEGRYHSLVMKCGL